MHKSISTSIPQFNTAFNNLDQLKEDIDDSKDKSVVLREELAKLKKHQLINLVKVQSLHKKKFNVCKTVEILKYITILR